MISKKINVNFSVLIIISSFFLSIFISSCSSSKQGSDITTDDPERAYSIAKSRYDRKDYREAVEDFSYIKQRFPGTAISDRAQFYHGMSYQMLGEYVLAAYEFEYLIRNYPASPLVIEARYQLAMSYYYLSPDYRLDQTYTRYAISEFQTFIELYPTHKLASQSESRIRELKNKLALKAFRSGEQYLALESYKSALFYFEHVLSDYFDTDFADDALAAKIQVLVNRGRYAEAKDEIKRFEEKFRTSSLRARVDNLKRRIPA